LAQKNCVGFVLGSHESTAHSRHSKVLCKIKPSIQAFLILTLIERIQKAGVEMEDGKDEDGQQITQSILKNSELFYKWAR
jgi:hypothetical protein